MSRPQSYDHRLRDIAMLGREGVGLSQAQALLGHSDPKLTAAIYTYLGVEDLRGAVERLQCTAGSRPRPAPPK